MGSNYVTDRQIGDLLNEAAMAGDTEQVKLCEIALGVYLDDGGSYPSEVAQRFARDACAGAVAESRYSQPRGTAGPS